MKYVLIDLERSITLGAIYYWNPHRQGYTTYLEEAGMYSEKEALKLQGDDFDERTIAIKLSVIDNILK